MSIDSGVPGGIATVLLDQNGGCAGPGWAVTWYSGGHLAGEWAVSGYPSSVPESSPPANFFVTVSIPQSGFTPPPYDQGSYTVSVCVPILGPDPGHFAYYSGLVGVLEGTLPPPPGPGPSCG